MPEKQETFKIMHDKGEKIEGKNLRPYDTFKSVMTPDLEVKVKKGYLEVISSTPKKKALKRSRTVRK